MKIFLRVSLDQFIALDVDPQESVESIKAFLEVETSGSLQHLQLQFDGKELKNSDRLSSIGVLDGHTITMVAVASGSRYLSNHLPHSHNIESEGGSHELYIVPKDAGGSGDFMQYTRVFVARNRFAVLDKSSNQVLVKNLKNEIVMKSILPIVTDAIIYAGRGNLLCQAKDKVVMLNLQQGIILGELQAPAVKYIVWSGKMENVALISNVAIVIADKKLVHRYTLHETIHVDSGAWDENGVFIYTTLNRIKYCLPNGDSGIIGTLDAPVYLSRVAENTLFCVDRDGEVRIISINATEYIFKLALSRKRFDHVMSMIKNSQLCGQAIIAYLQKKGFPEVALHLVKDEQTRFNLALESGNIQAAVASAKEIDEEDHWNRLGIEALRQGNTSIVEYAYQRTKNFERLSFLYVVTGNREKLSKTLRIAEMKNDVRRQFHNALYLGDVEERVKILENADQLPLAYVTAAAHGLTETAARLAAELEHRGIVPSIPEGKTRSLMMPPAPLICSGDWPLLRVMRGIFDGGLGTVGIVGDGNKDKATGADWGDEDLDIVDVDTALQGGESTADVDDIEVNGESDEEAGWDLEGLGLPPDVDIP